MAIYCKASAAIIEIFRIPLIEKNNIEPCQQDLNCADSCGEENYNFDEKNSPKCIINLFCLKHMTPCDSNKRPNGAISIYRDETITKAIRA
jgi:hypothetical protein